MKMRDTIRPIALCVGIFCFFFIGAGSPRAENGTAPALDTPAQSAPKENSANPDERSISASASKVFEKKERPPARFNHDKHAAALETEGCVRCHTQDSAGELLFTFPKVRNETNAKALMNSYHDECIGCHRQRAVEKKKSGPDSCGECHRAESGVLENGGVPVIYDLARGPLLWLAAVVFIAGIAYRIVELFLLTEKKERVRWPTRGIRVDSPAERKLRPILSFRHSLIGTHPVMAIVSGIFHTCLLGAPILAKGHALLLRQSWGISFWSLSSSLIDTLTVIVLLGVLFMFVRRSMIPRVRAVSSVYHFLFLFIAAAPYLTGFLAYHQWFHYKTILTLHMLAGELMLIVIPFTKLSHMVFFFFVRGFVGSEHNIARGNRVWSA